MTSRTCENCLYLAEITGENVAENGNVWCAKLADFIDYSYRCEQYLPRTENIRGSSYGT